MKKLMIAAAGAAMIGGAYATDCLDCNIRVVNKNVDAEVIEVYECTPEVYNVKFSLKTLAYKKLTGSCPGLYMENGTRTLEGILFTCCSDCNNWDPNGLATSTVFDPNKQFEYTLWEKSGNRVFTEGLTHNNIVTTYTTNYVYTYTAQHYVAAKTIKTGDFKAQSAAAAKAEGDEVLKTIAPAVKDYAKVYTEQLTTADTNRFYIVVENAQIAVTGTGANEAAAKAAAKGVYDLTGALVDYSEKYEQKVNKVDVTDAGANRYNDTAANIELFVYGKKAMSAEALWIVDTINDAGTGKGTKKTAENGVNAEADDVQLWAAGFGSITTDKGKNNETMYVIKSLSGNCAGMITPVAKDSDCEGQVATMCDEYDGIDWCWSYEVSTLANTFASGTWSIKYVKSIKGGSIAYAVPAFARDL